MHKEKSNIENLLEPIKKILNEKGVSICSDGWSDVQRRPLINIMVVSEGEPMFLKAISCEGETKNKHFIVDMLINTIQETGPQKVVQVITDNGVVCKAAGHIVEAKCRHMFWTPCAVHTLNLALKNICAPSTHPRYDGHIVEAKFRHIFWAPCVVHTLNLALKSICAPSTHLRYDDAMEQCGWISWISSDTSFIKNFIMNHVMRLPIFNNHCKLKLLSVVDIHFSLTIVMLKRLKTIKIGLEQLVISEE